MTSPTEGDPGGHPPRHSHVPPSPPKARAKQFSFIDVGGVEGACTSSYVDFHSLTTQDIDDVVRGDASLFRCRRVCRFGQWSTVVFYTCELIFGLVSVLLI